MNPASPFVTFTPNNENKKRKNNMQEDSFMALPSKRINTGYDSPDSMTMIEDDATMNQLHPLPEATTTTATAINIPSMSIDNRTSNMDYHLSLNATTPAYAPCDTSYGMSRPSTPPFSMTLAHYNEASGGYTSSHIGF